MGHIEELYKVTMIRFDKSIKRSNIIRLVFIVLAMAHLVCNLGIIINEFSIAVVKLTYVMSGTLFIVFLLNDINFLIRGRQIAKDLPNLRKRIRFSLFVRVLCLFVISMPALYKYIATNLYDNQRQSLDLLVVPPLAFSQQPQIEQQVSKCLKNAECKALINNDISDIWRLYKQKCKDSSRATGILGIASQERESCRCLRVEILQKESRFVKVLSAYKLSSFQEGFLSKNLDHPLALCSKEIGFYDLLLLKIKKKLQRSQ